MKKSFNEIKKIAKIIDLFIVVLDARAPLSTYNQDFDTLSISKPRLFVFSKIDLGDQNKLNGIIKKFQYKNDNYIFVNLKKSNSGLKILKKTEKILINKRKINIKKGIINPKLYVAVVGIPNAGKSTLINLIAKKTKVNVANEPGVTRYNTWINAGKILLMDTPGILWPKLENWKIIIKLAIIGAIKTSLIPQEELFYQTYKLLSEQYPDKIKKLNLIPNFDRIKTYAELIKLCKMKNFLQRKNKVNINEAMIFFINYVKKIKGVTYD